MAGIRPTFKDVLSSIPGVFGIRLEEEPAYTVVDSIGSVEIRKYLPAVLAEVSVEGDHDSALDIAFRKLAGYIYGENSDGQKLGMTSPVFQEARGESSTMRAPITQRADGGAWTVAFFLFNSLSTDAAPLPTDSSVILVQQPETTLASLRFSGNNSHEARAEAKQKLLSELDNSPRWRVIDGVTWAQYDQPFAIPFLKRNEAHAAVEEVIDAPHDW